MPLAAGNVAYRCLGQRASGVSWYTTSTDAHGLPVLERNGESADVGNWKFDAGRFCGRRELGSRRARRTPVVDLRCLHVCVAVVAKGAGEAGPVPGVALAGTGLPAVAGPVWIRTEGRA